MRKPILQRIIKENPEAVLVENKYKVIAQMAFTMYPELQTIPKKRLTDIVYEIVNADRDWRKLTEYCDRENKDRLEEKKLTELGYTPTP